MFKIASHLNLMLFGYQFFRLNLSAKDVTNIVILHFKYHLISGFALNVHKLMNTNIVCHDNINTASAIFKIPISLEKMILKHPTFFFKLLLPG